MAVIGQQVLNPESGWSRVDFPDRRVVLSGNGWTINDSTTAPVAEGPLYGGFQFSLNKAVSGLTGSYLMFAFTGTRLRLYCNYVAATDHPTAVDVFIDGIFHSTYSEYRNVSPSTQILSFEVTGLTNAKHTIKFVAKEEGKWTTFDCVDIDSGCNIFHPYLNEVTSLSNMQVGDIISCEYVSSSNTAGVFSNLGNASKKGIFNFGETAPNGSFNFIKVDKGLLIADRVVQTGISWDKLNAGKFIFGGKNLSYYLFENNSEDSSQLARTLTTIGAGYAAGKSGQGFVSGNGKYYRFENFVSSLTSYSMGGWFKVDPTTRNTGTNPLNYLLCFTTKQANGMAIVVSPDGFYGLGYWNGSSHIDVKSSTAATNTWVHLAATYDGTTTRLYVNGVSATTTTFIPAVGSVHFSNAYANINNYARQISSIDDEVFVTSRCLTASDISQIYNEGVVTHEKYSAIRSLSGGAGFLTSSQVLDNNNKNLGAFPVTNEWDSYVVNSNLRNKISAGDNIVWNWANVDSNVSNWVQETPTVGIAASSNRIVRGYANARSFNGTSDFISFSSSIIPVGAKTISFSIKTTGTSTGWKNILNTRGSTSGMVVYFTQNTGTLVFQYRNGASTNIYTLSSTFAINDGLWHSIKFTHDGTTNANGVKLYIDDMITPNRTGTASAIESTASANLFIGRAADVATDYFAGQLDELQILDGNGRMILYLPLNEVSGNPVDQSGNAYTATATGTTVVAKAKLNGFSVTASSTTTSGIAGFRPVLEYYE